VSLPPQLEQYVREKVESGLYSSASEVVREALRLLQEHERDPEARLARLRKDIEEADQALEEGRYVDLDRHELKALLNDIVRRDSKRAS